jgi:rhodanese-related sulfurtransferase
MSSPRRFSKLAAALVAAWLLTGCSGAESEPPASTPAPGSGSAAVSPGYVRDLPPAEFDDYVRRHPDAFLVDVRQSIEWDDDLGHLETAVQIPLEDLESRLGELPTDHLRPVAVYDRLDVRSSAAARRIAQLGFREVVTLSGGLAAYRRAGY